MARLVVTLGLALWWFAAAAVSADVPKASDIPNPRSTHSGWVTDQAQILGAVLPELEQRFERLKQQTGHEVALVILPSIGGAQPRAFATELFAHWGIGRKGEDDGVLVLHVLDQRRLEIETGYGAETLLPDAKCSWLVHEVALPFFLNNELARGHLALAAGLDAALRDPALGHGPLIANAREAVSKYVGPLPAERSGPPPDQRSGNWHWLLAGFAAALAAQLFRRRAHRAYERGQIVQFPASNFGFVVGLVVVAFLAFYEKDLAVPKVSIIAAMLLASALAVHALYLSVKAYRRSKRSCLVCHQSMSLLDSMQSLSQLTPGQQTEYKLGSMSYRCFRCPSGHSYLEQDPGVTPLPTCRFCGFRTEKDLGTEVVQQATPRSNGCVEHRYACHHCTETRIEVSPTYYSSPGSSLSSSSSTSSDSGSSSDSSSDSFGGGTSGGGGAGGSY